MAFYKNPSFLEKSNYKEFDALYGPGEAPEFSGIYRCEVCRREIVAEKGKNLPPANHHQHTGVKAEIKWRLVVAHA